MSQFVYRVYAAFIQSRYTIMLLFEGSWNLSRPFLSYLDFACRPFPIQLLVHAPYDRVLPHYTIFAEYLMLDDGGCLNSLLPADFIPSTSDHLFWDWNLESFVSALRLAVISGRFSRHRQFFGNTSMSHDRCILSSVRPQHIYSHLLVCTLVPWFPFSSSVGDLASVNSIH